MRVSRCMKCSYKEFEIVMNTIAHDNELYDDLEIVNIIANKYIIEVNYIYYDYDYRIGGFR